MRVTSPRSARRRAAPRRSSPAPGHAGVPRGGGLPGRAGVGGGRGDPKAGVSGWTRPSPPATSSGGVQTDECGGVRLDDLARERSAVRFLKRGPRRASATSHGLTTGPRRSPKASAATITARRGDGWCRGMPTRAPDVGRDIAGIEYAREAAGDTADGAWRHGHDELAALRGGAPLLRTGPHRRPANPHPDGRRSRTRRLQRRLYRVAAAEMLVRRSHGGFDERDAPAARGGRAAARDLSWSPIYETPPRERLSVLR